MNATSRDFISNVGRLVDEIDAMEDLFDRVRKDKPSDELFAASNHISELRLDVLDAAVKVRATSLPELIPQLGWAFERIDNSLGSDGGQAIEDLLRMLHFVIAGALVVIRDAIPPEELRCAFLVDQAARMAFDNEGGVRHDLTF